MKYFKQAWVFFFAIVFTSCIGGCSMKGKTLPGGWLEFEGKDANITRPGTHANIFYLNWGQAFAWAKYDAKEQTLKVETSRFGYSDGSWNEFRDLDWQMSTPDFKTFLLYQGRGINLYREPNSIKPVIELVDLNYDDGANWMWVNPDYTKALIPLSRTVKMDDDFFFGGTPLIPFHIDLVKGTYTTEPMDHFADSYLGPDFILWRHYTHDKEKGAKPSHFTATDFEMKEKDLPLVHLLNRYNDSLPDFQREFKISAQGWALLGVSSPKTTTQVFLVDPSEKGRILPLFETGIYALPDMSKCAISEDGQYFAIRTENHESFPNAKGTIIHLGRVEKIGGHFLARVTRIADFIDLALEPPVWIPGTHALTVVTNSIEFPSAIRIFDLDKHPVDWSKIPNATPVEGEKH